ncbi:Txe/YoeB family addiction module toxin [Methylobacterium sp. SyP6R]|uniref:Txe/YoeB family addiction module toxin n=1 Tax=Methylobacterium sp. SyP6R TaxID=2718876 RepID=UPI001EFF82BE|nr:Txe/YoeB family addiction module toxin [Methylobacterium sp. SyP6R]MCF4126830.1 Txe/YoeB family addiction module toxin [Methylobacterium sp. SyP6R]
MKLTFSDDAWSDYLFWQGENTATLERINALIKEIKRTPFTGTGKPEPLKFKLKGWWSRRISGEHRLVYRVSGSSSTHTLEIAQCRWHYDD